MKRLSASLVNDLEAGVASCCPDVSVARAALQEAGATGVVMSGSGPTVVGLATDREHACEVRSRLTLRGFEINIAEATGRGSLVTGRG